MDENEMKSIANLVCYGKSLLKKMKKANEKIGNIRFGNEISISLSGGYTLILKSDENNLK